MTEINQMDESDEFTHLPISWEEKGKELGREEGKEIAVRNVALGMLKEGLSIEFIAKVTRLDLDVIEKLKEKT